MELRERERRRWLDGVKYTVRFGFDYTQKAGWGRERERLGEKKCKNRILEPCAVSLSPLKCIVKHLS